MQPGDRLVALEEGVDLRYYLGLLRRHRSLVASVFFIATSLVAIYAFRLPDVYEAQAQLVLERPIEKTPYAELKPADDIRDLFYFNTQSEILKSADLIEKAIRSGNLLDAIIPPGKAKRGKTFLTEEERMRAAVASVKGGLLVQQIRLTRVYTVAVRRISPYLAKEIANGIARSYVKDSIESKLYIPKELLQFFPDDAEKIQVHTPYGQLQELSQQQIAETLPSVANDPLIRQLKAKLAEKESELHRLLETYKEKHPKVVEARSEIEFLTNRIRVETDNIISSLKASLTQELQISSVRILKEAEVPTVPVAPKRIRIILFFSFFSLFISSGFVFFRDRLDDTIKSQDDVEMFVQTPYLGHIPLLKGKTQGIFEKNFFVHQNPLSDLSEAFRYVKVAINFSGAPGTLKALVVTSATSEEGKSFIASNIAASFLKDNEKVLLIDADLRRPMLHIASGVSNTKGLSNYLSSNVSLSEVVQKTHIPNLDVLASGPLSPNPTELFGSYRMEHLLTEAKTKYDRVLIDTPPVLGLADSLVLGTKCDAAVLTIHCRGVGRGLVKKARERLLSGGVKLIGVILNKIDLDKEEKAYRYYAYSGKYYRKDDAKNQGAK